MTSKKLPLVFALVGLSLGAGGCASLGQYGALAQPAPGAGTAAAPAAAPGAPSAPSAAEAASESQSGPASSVSVTIKSSCAKTVKVFYGDKPKFGSGTYSTASSNSRSSHSFRPGDQFWIVDDSENGVASVEVGESTREIEILGSCNTLAAR